MTGEARLVAILDQCRARGWTFEPEHNGCWTVKAPKWIIDQYPAAQQPSLGHHGLVEALAYASGCEQAIEWVKFAQHQPEGDAKNVD